MGVVLKENDSNTGWIIENEEDNGPPSRVRMTPNIYTHIYLENEE